MAIGEEFYFYQYPFFFPNSFLSCKNKYDLEIKLQLIESFSTVELEKKLLVKKFLNQFSVPNKDLAKIKKQLHDAKKHFLKVNQQAHKRMESAVQQFPRCLLGGMGYFLITQ